MIPARRFLSTVQLKRDIKRNSLKQLRHGRARIKMNVQKPTSFDDFIRKDVGPVELSRDCFAL